MDSINDYRARVTGSIRSNKIKNAKRSIVNSFLNHPSYRYVGKLIANTITPISLDSWIVDDSKTAELKTITLMPEQTISSGDYILWNSEYWINLITDFQGDIYYRGSIKKCESSLKWKDSLGAIKEAYFTLAASDQRGLGIEEGKVMILPSERRYITLQNNADTIQIVKNQRFIFDNGKTFKVVSANTLKTGLISMEMEETEFSVELDNLSLRIANYYLNNYTIDITNGSTANLSVVGTLQLNVVTKNNGTVASLPVTYTSLTPSIATVNSSGLITTLLDGSVTVKASLTNDPTVFANISIVVSSVVTPINSISISGANSIKVTLSQTINGSVMVNGVGDGSKTITWSLFASNGVDSTTLAVITGQTGTNVTIKANSVMPYRFGDVILKAVCIQDFSIVATKTLQIKSLF